MSGKYQSITCFCFGTILLVTAMLLVSFKFQPPTRLSVAADMPLVLDDRLELTLLAENPDIVTPIGIAVDSLDRIFVLESHTHQPPADYQGPKSDRIKVFVDENGDGRPERMSVFAEGFKEGVNLAFSPEGDLYVVTSKAVWVLFDRDGDGVSDERKKVVELTRPTSVYAHAALLGITFSQDGWMYISRGNTSSAYWEMAGTDGSTLNGYGDGGNVVRARPDGSRLEEVSTGFWNPVDIKFDDKGHLLAADNDPDSRGPNRLVHVIPGGDYGYQSLYGGSGIHPYLAWNGELPGTLPFSAGLGEAPSGLLNASLAALPDDYRGQMLASIWEESRIVRINLQPKGVSVTGTTETILQGGQNFRPVAFSTDSKGTIYFTDWVLRTYPNHGKGKIWKLSTKKDQKVTAWHRMYTSPNLDKEGEPLGAVYSIPAGAGFDILRNALASEDAFLRQAAVFMLSHQSYRPKVIQAAAHSNSLVRLGAMQALQKMGYQPDPEQMQKYLTDPDERVRRRALIWVGQTGRSEMSQTIEKALQIGTPSSILFETYLETIRHLQPEFIGAYRNHSETYAKSIHRNLPPRFIEDFIGDNSRSDAIRAMAIKLIEHPDQQVDLLLPLLTSSKAPLLQLEAIRSLAVVPEAMVAEELLALAIRKESPVSVRSEALLALARQPLDASMKVLPLLNDPSTDIQLEAARYLRRFGSVPTIKKALEMKYSQKNTPMPIRQQLAFVVLEDTDTKNGRPTTYEEWETALEKAGDPSRGRRVFYSTYAVCSSCHTIQGRGGDLGPDLSNVGQSKSHSQLIRSILRPSAEITPEWQGWYIQMKNGDYHQGRQIDVGEKNVELLTQESGFQGFSKKEIKDYGLIKNSLMPEGLESQLSVSDLRDLLSFLEIEK